MQSQKPTSHAEACAICGVRKISARNWFLITENSGEDQLHVWTYDGNEPAEVGVQVLCSPKHVRELVTHWMTTGCLEYPFASKRDADRGSKINAGPAWVGKNDRNSPALLCTLAVDRCAVVRAARQNALALNTILDEMMMALEKEAATDIDEFDYGASLALPGVD